MKRKFKGINKEVVVIASDSSQEARIENRYLPGGTLNILLGRVVGLHVQHFIKTDRKGR